jgi:transcriptional regulator with XRE-family HTH domain
MPQLLDSEIEKIKRLKQVRLEKGLSQQQMADILGIKRPNLSAIENFKDNRTVPNGTAHILEVEFYINRKWFNTGVGSMYLDHDSVIDIMDKKIDYHVNAQAKVDKKIVETVYSGYIKHLLNEPGTEYNPLPPNYIPIYSSEISSGLNNNKKLTPIGWLNTPEFQGCDAIIKVKDDSMSGRINEGDWIGIKKVNEWEQFLPMGYIYAISTGDLELIRTLKKGKTDSSFKTVSANKEFGDEELPKNLIKEVWSVKTILPYSKVETLL